MAKQKPQPPKFITPSDKPVVKNVGKADPKTFSPANTKPNPELIKLLRPDPGKTA